MVNQIKHTDRKVFDDKTLEKRRKLLKSNDKEIAKIKDLHKKQKLSTHVEGEKDLLEIHDKNQRILGEEVKHKEERLTKLREDLKVDQGKFQTEKDNLKGYHNSKIGQLRSHFDEHFTNQFIESKEQSDSIQEDQWRKLRNIEEDAELEVNAKRLDTQRTMSESSQGFDDRLRAQQNKHIQLAEINQKGYDHVIKSNEQNHVRTLDTQTHENKRDIEIRKRMHSDRIQYMEDFHLQKLQQQEEKFNTKYTSLKKRHDDAIAKMNERFDFELATIKEKNSSFKIGNLEKTDDKFYNIKMLEPALKDNGKDYTLSLEIPKYEMENVDLTADKRELKLSFTRRFADSKKSEEGIIDRTKRTETFTKLVNTEDIMDSRNITQKYEDGVLTFKIAKL